MSSLGIALTNLNDWERSVEAIEASRKKKEEKSLPAAAAGHDSWVNNSMCNEEPVTIKRSHRKREGYAFITHAYC